MSIHIEGRRWFQRTYGNTYNSVRIFKDGAQVAYLPRAICKASRRSRGWKEG